MWQIPLAIISTMHSCASMGGMTTSCNSKGALTAGQTIAVVVNDSDISAIRTTGNVNVSSCRQGKAQKQCTVFKEKVGKLSEDGTARGCAADLRGMCRDLIRDQSQRRSPRAVDR